jgi:hypothetical protein
MTATHTPTYIPPNRGTLPVISIRKQGRQWAVHKDGVLVEGGFFSRDAAHAAAIERARDAISDAA